MTMIEKMARAIHEANYHPDDHGTDIVNEHWEFEQDKAFRRAKAALQALKEPSEGVAKSAAVALFRRNGHVSGPALAEYYTAMIEAILTEGESQ